MLRLPVRRFFLCLLLLCAASAPALSAETGWTLWKNNGIAGVVRIRDEGSTVKVGLKNMASLLGCGAAVKGDRLVVTFESRKLEFVLGAAAARIDGGQILPMADAVTAEGGEWWGENRGALRLFEALLSRGKGSVRLRFAGAAALPEKEAPPAAAATPAAVESPEPGKSLYGPLPRIEKIRWSRTAEKIRAVLDLSSPLEPTVKDAPGELEITLAAAAARSISGVPSPYPEEVTVAFTQYGDKTVVRFQHHAGSVKTFSLHKPERFVLDFFSSGTAASGVEPAASVEPAPVLPKPAEPAAPPAAAPVPAGRAPGGKPFLVVVDAGHGGHDPGAVAGGINEKDINLRAALRLAVLLREAGIEARLTRKDDTYLRLNERTDLANRWNADLFISLHCNALPRGRHARGVEIYLMALPTDKDAMRLALYENRELGRNNTIEESDAKTNLLLRILGEMEQNAKIGQSTRLAESLFNMGRRTGLQMSRVAQAPFFVLRGAAMPAVLVEMGYLTEPEDRKLLNDPAFLDRLLRALVSGMSEYLNTLSR